MLWKKFNQYFGIGFLIMVFVISYILMNLWCKGSGELPRTLLLEIMSVVLIQYGVIYYLKMYVCEIIQLVKNLMSKK